MFNLQYWGSLCLKPSFWHLKTLFFNNKSLILAIKNTLAFKTIFFFFLLRVPKSVNSVDSCSQLCVPVHWGNTSQEIQWIRGCRAISKILRRKCLIFTEFYFSTFNSMVIISHPAESTPLRPILVITFPRKWHQGACAECFSRCVCSYKRRCMAAESSSVLSFCVTWETCWVKFLPPSARNTISWKIFYDAVFFLGGSGMKAGRTSLSGRKKRGTASSLER